MPHESPHPPDEWTAPLAYERVPVEQDACKLRGAHRICIRRGHVGQTASFVCIQRIDIVHIRLASEVLDQRVALGHYQILFVYLQFWTTAKQISILHPHRNRLIVLKIERLQLATLSIHYFILPVICFFLINHVDVADEFGVEAVALYFGVQIVQIGAIFLLLANYSQGQDFFFQTKYIIFKQRSN